MNIVFAVWFDVSHHIIDNTFSISTPNFIDVGCGNEKDIIFYRVWNGDFILIQHSTAALPKGATSSDSCPAASLETIRKLSSQLWHPCSFCGKMFPQSCDLQRHVLVHTGEKPFECSICHKTFNQQINLKVHFRTHTGEKPYVCSVCTRAFNSSSDLKKHFRIHTGEKPFKCQHCEYSGVSSSHLKRHMRFKHSD